MINRSLPSVVSQAMAFISRENRRALRILRPVLEQNRLMSTKPEDKAKADWKFQFNKTKSGATSPQKYPENTNQSKGPFSLNGKAHIALANEALFGPVIKTSQVRMLNSTASFFLRCTNRTQGKTISLPSL